MTHVWEGMMRTFLGGISRPALPARSRLAGLVFAGLVLAACATRNGAQPCDNGRYCPAGTECSADNTTCIQIGGCGNAVTGDAEECDDGNFNDNDNCLATCKFNTCGDGKIDQESKDAADPTEECDDGNAQNNDDCLVTCKLNRCRDGEKDEQLPGIEVCDDGDEDDTNGCYNDCSGGAGCGNGRIDYNSDGSPIEECDDGNTSNVDDCVILPIVPGMPTYRCRRSRCGDGITAKDAPGPHQEQCDGGALTASGPIATAACNLDCTSQRCGDGVINQAAGEECDDTNDVATDGCLPDLPNNPTLSCKLATCGDDFVDDSEQCDGGNQEPADGCSPSCLREECSNGILDPGEDCDDDNEVTTDDCVLCHYAACGDGFVQAVAEDCDGGAGCDPNCRTTGCGNGFRGADEPCDDGNRVNGDGCSADCKLERCGNGIDDPGEQCDPGAAGETALCDRDCTLRRCGDGVVNLAAGEACDDRDPGGPEDNLDNCRNDCTLNICGDDFEDREEPRIEACDDGNLTNGDGCNADCTLPGCGNGTHDPGEECDDGNDSDSDGCLTGTCRRARCGDGKVHDGVEQCDDGNLLNGDDCLDTCRDARCGDGFRDQLGPSTEVCDDGNRITEAACGYGVASCVVCDRDCAAELERTGAFCGDGIKDALEVCDDGNRITEAACPYGEATCARCNSACSASLALTGAFCGDGVPNGPEVCDDGNVLACGACSASCQVAIAAAAQGFVIPAPGSALVDGDAFTIDDGLHMTPTTFEFTNATPGPDRIAIPFAAADSAVVMQARIVTAINGVGAALEVSAAIGAGSLIRLVHDRATALGNRPIDDAVATPGFGAIGMSGGLGGDCDTGDGCNADDVCRSGSCSEQVCR
jgi:cysteine-rich repeat protein